MDDIDSLRVLGPIFPPAWLCYRDAFAVLQYLRALSAGDPGISVPWQKLVVELGFSDRQGDQLLAYLLAVDCLENRQGRREVALKRKALEYLDRERGRRRSVRPELSHAAAGAA